MSSKIIQTSKAPAAIGPYSQGMVSNGFLFTAGQIALDPKTGEMMTGDVRSQTEQVFANLKAVLEEAGASFKDVVKAHVYLISMKDFPALNEVYAQYLGEAKPARATVAVAELPLGGRVEIDLIARIPA